MECLVKQVLISGWNWSAHGQFKQAAITDTGELIPTEGQQVFVNNAIGVATTLWI